MKQVMSILFISIIGIIACKSRKQTPGEDTVEQKKEEVAQNPAKDSAEIRRVVTDFYTWYNTNYAKFQEYDLYSGIKKKDAPPYKINWDEVEKYHDFIRTSVPQLGEEFIKNQKRFFEQCDSAFKVDTEDDIPYGFDYDWYTNSQEEPEYLLEAITKWVNWWDIKVNGNDAMVEINGYRPHNGKQAPITIIGLTMKKEKDKWKIARIAP